MSPRRKEGVAHGTTKQLGSAQNPQVFVGAKGPLSIVDIDAGSRPILPNRLALRGPGHDMWSSKKEVRVGCSLVFEGTEVAGRFAHYLLLAFFPQFL